MQRFVRWYHVTSITLAAVAVVGSLTLTLFTKTAPVVAQSTNIRGWAWSGTAGWISLSSANCADLNQAVPGSCTTSNVAYGVNLALNSTTGGSMSGYAWSQNAGWICFGTTCAGDPPGADASPAITFTCNDLDGTPLACDSLKWSKCSVANKMCSEDADCPDGETCNATGNAPSVTLSGWARAVNVPGDQGWIDLRGGTAEGADWTWTKLFFERGKCSVTTTLLCTTSNQCGGGQTCVPNPDIGAGLGGWAYQYAGGPSTDPYGMGWVSFDEQSPEVLFPYLSAEGGDVFSRSVRTAFPPPRDKYNAQYLVHVRSSNPGDLSARFRSKCVDVAACRNRSYELELPQDPTSDTGYTFRLGRFDFQGLMGPTNTSGVNTYGHQVVRLNESQVLPGSVGSPVQNQALSNRVYVLAPEDLTYTISQPIEFKNSSSTAVSGAGTVVVRGNLQVDANISYESTAVGSERGRLASVVWIVLGDVTVSPSVSKLAGTFIILGRRGNALLNGVCSGGTDPMKPCSSVSDCGGTGATCVPSGLCVTPSGQNCVAACGTTGQQCIPNPNQLGTNQCVTVGSTACSATSACTTGAQCRTKCLLKDANGNLQPDCGRFVSGAGNASSLTVSGSVFARQFILERSFVDPATKAAAERFTADGRLQLNPPPGMADFAKGLPAFRRQ